MTDERPEGRPAPMYGEYAPPGWVSPAQHVDPAEPVPVPAQAPAPQASGGEGSGWPAVAPEQAKAKRRTWDIALTVGLLLLGTWSVAGSVAQYANLGTVLTAVFDQLGAGEFTSFELAATVGLVANLVQIGLLILAIALALWSLARGRLAFIYPLAAGVLATIVLTVLMGAVIVSDPAFLQYASNPPN
ncbi:DUF6264 family protein [Herbiconiux sp. SYSU D00978]|uniref:DUF6264 family protein n=1 Tax=Herbiconiux sp. SYSU D00978 TaxID=2812562 RepID=UPI001A96664C|nr:DUF6264 family protein [Herbiconiux sp. SYSU D00978]